MATGDKAFREVSLIDTIPVWFALASNSGERGDWFATRDLSGFRRNLNLALAYHFAGSVDETHPTIRLTVDHRKTIPLREPRSSASLSASAEIGRATAQDTDRVEALWRQIRLQRDFLIKPMDRRQRLELARRYF